MLVIDRRLDEKLVGNVLVEKGLARTADQPQPLLGIELVGIERAQALGHVELARVDVRNRDRLACTFLVEQVDAAPVGDLGDGETCHVAKRLLVVQRGGQHLTGAREELHSQGRSLRGRHVLDDRDGGLDRAAGLAHGGRLQHHPLLLARLPVHRAHRQRHGLLAAQRANRGEVVHADLTTVLPDRLPAVHQLPRVGLAEFLDRVEPHTVERRPIGVDQLVVGAPDRHRLTERINDHG